MQTIEQRVAELERKLAQVERAAAGGLSVAVNQQGPLPGWLTGGQFGPGVNQKASLHIKNDGNQIGSSPRLTVNDPNGVTRIELGNLAANGNSPAQWGARALTAGNVPFFDTGGLFKGVMESLGLTDVGSNSFTTTTFTQVSGTPINFTLTRTVNLMTLFLSSGFVSATGGNNIGLMRCNLVGVGTSGSLQFGVGSIVTLMGWRFYPAVVAGSYTVQMEASVAQTPLTFSTTETALQLLQLGA